MNTVYFYVSSVYPTAAMILAIHERIKASAGCSVREAPFIKDILDVVQYIDPTHSSVMIVEYDPMIAMSVWIIAQRNGTHVDTVNAPTEYTAAST